MKKLILYIASSLNGYIAKPNGNVDWLESMPNPNQEDYGYFDFYNSCDVTLQGHNTYKFILNSGHDFPYKSTKNFVFTKDTSLEDNEDVQFVAEDIPAFVKNLKKEKGKNIWLIGGAQINSLLIGHKLIDEIWIHVMPIVLNDGIPIFNSLLRDVQLELNNSKTHESGVVGICYKIKY